MRHLSQTLKLAVAGTAVLGVGLVLAPSSAQAFLPSADTTVSGLTDAQLIAMYEEERLAGDVYDRLAEKTGALIFTNISAAEDRHQAAVATLLQARDVAVTELPTAAGDYATAGYAEMYTQFVTTGQQSLAAAFQVGVDIESADISDLESLLTQTTDPAEVRVLTALLNGSQHHLTAFSSEPTTGATGQVLMNQNRFRMHNGYGDPGAGVRSQAQDGRSPRQRGTAGVNGPGPHSSTPGECDGSGRQRGYGR